MPLIHENTHDIFISYCHDDNVFFNQYVTEFRDELYERLGAAARRFNASLKGKEPDIFIDQSGLPMSGDLNSTLREHIERSELLFVFVGKLYFQSDYCGKELEWFRNRFRGVTKTALERTYVIMLEPGFIEDARRTFGSNDAEAILIPFYDRATKQPIMPEQKHQFESVFVRLISDVAERIDQIIEASRPAVSAPKTDKFLIGITPKWLEPVRHELAEHIKQGGAGVHLVDRDDLLTDPEKVKALAASASVFIQPFDNGRVECNSRNDPPGGHLAIQERVLAETGINWQWWRVPDETVAEKTGFIEETNPDDVAFIKDKSRIASKRTADALAQDLLKELEPKETLCRILIERNVDDRECREALDRFLRSRWAAGGREACPLVIEKANWNNIRSEPDWHYHYHGFIMIDRSKPFRPLQSQIDDITRMLIRSTRKLVCGFFTLPPKSEPTMEPDTTYWSSIIVFGYTDSKEFALDEDGEAQLEEFFQGVYEIACQNTSSPEHVGV